MEGSALMMGYLEELKEYRQPNGLYSNQKNPKDDSTGNGLAITSLVIISLQNKTTLISTDFFRTVRSCNVPNFPGLLNRSPTKIGDQEGYDDYIAVSAAIHSISPEWNKVFYFLNHAKYNHWSFNNVDSIKWTWKSFFGRYPIFCAHLIFAYGEMPNLFFRMYWCLGIFLSKFSKDPSSIVLNYMAIQTAKGKSKICDFVSKYWSHDVKKAIALWLSVDKDSDGKDLPNLDHPIVKYWET